MADLTEEEYDALDEYYTENPPKVDPEKKEQVFYPTYKRSPHHNY